MRFHGGSSIFTLIWEADGINKKKGVGEGAGLIAGMAPFRDQDPFSFIHSFIQGCFSFLFFPGNISRTPPPPPPPGAKQRSTGTASSRVAVVEEGGVVGVEGRGGQLTNSVLHDDKNNRLPSTQLAAKLPLERPSGRLAVCPGSNHSCWLSSPVT